MSRTRDGRPSVLIIHENPRIARFFEGVLRGGFRADSVMDCCHALDALRIDPPDLILCDISCLAGNAAGFLDTLREEFDFAQVPLIVVTDDHTTQLAEVVRLRFGDVDCVHKSISPLLLNWKVANWLHIAQEVERIRESKSFANKQARRLQSQLEMLVHDLKSPLVALRGLLNRLGAKLVELSADPRILEDLQRLHDISRSMKDILDSGRNADPETDSRGKHETLQLDALAIQVVQQYQQRIEEKGIDVEIATGDAPAAVIGSRVDIRRVLDNLVANAILHAREAHNPRILVTILRKRRSVVAQVSDNGVGIPYEYQDKVFDRFFRVPGTGEKRGSGLGLHIVKELVEGHNGRVWVESEPGKGATFAFSLPKPVRPDHITLDCEVGGAPREVDREHW